MHRIESCNYDYEICKTSGLSLCFHIYLVHETGLHACSFCLSSSVLKESGHLEKGKRERVGKGRLRNLKTGSQTHTTKCECARACVHTCT